MVKLIATPIGERSPLTSFSQLSAMAEIFSASTLEAVAYPNVFVDLLGLIDQAMAL